MLIIFLMCVCYYPQTQPETKILNIWFEFHKHQLNFERIIEQLKFLNLSKEVVNFVK